VPIDPPSRDPLLGPAPDAAVTSAIGPPRREYLLVVGGLDANSNRLSSLELFDPSIEDWRSVGDLFYPRENHTATLVIDRFRSDAPPVKLSSS
jgi:hypothetical protein